MPSSIRIALELSHTEVLPAPFKQLLVLATVQSHWVSSLRRRFDRQREEQARCKRRVNLPDVGWYQVIAYGASPQGSCRPLKVGQCTDVFDTRLDTIKVRHVLLGHQGTINTMKSGDVTCSFATSSYGP